MWASVSQQCRRAADEARELELRSLNSSLWQHAPTSWAQVKLNNVSDFNCKSHSKKTGLTSEVWCLIPEVSFQAEFKKNVELQSSCNWFFPIANRSAEENIFTQSQIYYHEIIAENFSWAGTARNCNCILKNTIAIHHKCMAFPKTFFHHRTFIKSKKIQNCFLRINILSVEKFCDNIECALT